jgi:hypothetical protein
MKCGKPSCEHLRSKDCSGCLKEGYCSPECQKDDWKIHRLMCPHMKNGDKLLPFQEVERNLRKFQNSKELSERGENVGRISEFCVTYAENQFGDRIPGQWYRERENGSRVDNWNVDVLYLEFFNFSIANSWRLSTNSIYNIDLRKESFKKAIYYYEKVLCILEPWRILHITEKHK